MSQLQVKQIAAPNFSASNNLAIESAKTLDRGFNTATSILKDLDTGQKEKNDIALAGEIAQLGSEEDLASFLDTGSFDGKNLSVGMTKRIAELRGTVLGFEQDRASIDLTGAQADNARASAASTLATSGRAGVVADRQTLIFNEGQRVQGILRERQSLLNKVVQDRDQFGDLFNDNGTSRVSQPSIDLAAFDAVNPLTQTEIDTSGQKTSVTLNAASRGEQRLRDVTNNNINQKVAQLALEIGGNVNIKNATDLNTELSKAFPNMTPTQRIAAQNAVNTKVSEPGSVVNERLFPTIQSSVYIDTLVELDRRNNELNENLLVDDNVSAIQVSDAYQKDPVGSLTSGLEGTEASQEGKNALNAEINRVKAASTVPITRGEAAYLVQRARELDQGNLFDTDGVFTPFGINETDPVSLAVKLFSPDAKTSARRSITDIEAQVKRNNNLMGAFTEVATQIQRLTRDGKPIPPTLQAKFNTLASQTNQMYKTPPPTPTTSTTTQQLINNSTSTNPRRNGTTLGAPTNAGRRLREFFGGTPRN